MDLPMGDAREEYSSGATLADTGCRIKSRAIAPLNASTFRTSSGRRVDESFGTIGWRAGGPPYCPSVL